CARYVPGTTWLDVW
nr:immunoglobulin heavy chain junction region [Macaca mulatta]MOW23402.1 immunoglobulin heavy chain junction region [Macaca mulatta]MOW24596.1 immunoglobulin heavy chain junction region [Macaca mulatta]